MKNTRKLISSGSTFEKEIGYSRAVVDGDWVFVSGTTGYDYKSMTLAGDIVSQTEQCFKNIEYALHQAGARKEHIVRVLYIVPVASEFKLCWPAIEKFFWRNKTGSHNDLCRPGRSGYENRNRGNGENTMNQ